MDTVQQRSLALLWNSSSGWGESPWSDSDEIRLAVESVLSGGGSSVDVRQIRRGMDIVKEGKAVVADGTDVLFAAGGDGTINAAATALIHQSTALGVIPAGTLNHFARDLEIPLDAEGAARALVNGRIIQVDAAAVNGRIFINNSVLGLFPNYRTVRESWERHGFRGSWLRRFIATVASIWKIFWRLPHLTISLSAGGRPRTMRTPFVLIGNNEHRMEGLALGRRSSLDAGKLWVYAMRPCSRWQLLRLVLGLVLGRAPRESLFEVFSAQHLTIDSRRRRIGVGIDGEMVRMKAPLHYECLPGALRVIAPSSYPSTDKAAD